MNDSRYFFFIFFIFLIVHLEKSLVRFCNFQSAKKHALKVIRKAIVMNSVFGLL